jgi:hypothetical protein
VVKYFVFVTVTVVFLLLPHFFDYLAFVSFFFFFFFLLLPCWSREINTLPGVGFSWIVNMKSTYKPKLQPKKSCHLSINTCIILTSTKTPRNK